MKPLNAPGSNSSSSLGQMGPVDITTLPHAELVQRVRKLEWDILKLAKDHNHMIREANNRIHVRNKIRSVISSAFQNANYHRSSG